MTQMYSKEGNGAISIWIPLGFRLRACLWLNMVLLFATTFSYRGTGSENVPYRPFAQWADVQGKGQFVIGAVYEQSESYDIWAAGERHEAPDGAPAAVHINQ